MNNEPKQIIETEVAEALSSQQELALLEQELSQNETFQRFIALRNAVDKKMTDVRTRIKDTMIPAYMNGSIGKKISGDWGMVIVTESDVFEIDEKKLPDKYWKRVPDTTKIRTMYQLEGKEIKGTTHSKTYNIQLKLKSDIVKELLSD